MKTLRMPETVRALHIDVYADVVCPWCWIGERRLQRALAEHQDLDVTLAWRPFQLDPTVPPAGRDWQEVVEQKFGGAARAAEMFAQVAKAASADAVTFHFDRISRAPNTVRAHALLLHAASGGRQWQLAEALFSAYFHDGRDIGDVATLRAISETQGLDGAEVEMMLLEGRYDLDIQQSQRDAARLGVRGVPFVVVDNRFGISGAQPEAIFRQAIAQAMHRDK